MRSKYYFFATILMISGILLGCDSKKPVSSDEKAITESKSRNKLVSGPLPECGSLEGDTINLHGKFILFYGPERGSDKIVAESSEIIEFQNTSAGVLDSLKNQTEIFTSYTSVNNLRIFNKSDGKPMIIQRNSFKEPTGIIVSDGIQPPSIKKGTFTSAEYQELISRYFHRNS